MLRLIAFLALLLPPAPGIAAVLPDGRCAVILASRRDMAEVAAWVAANPAYEVQGLYQSANGYLAISGGVIATEGWREDVARRKAAGRAPPDAFCSARGLVARIWSRDEGVPPPWGHDTPAAGAQDDLFAPFDARGLGVAEKRMLQAALAAEGAYSGLLDGAWGAGSQAALDGWTQAVFGRDATPADAALLLDGFAARVGREGWGWTDPSATGLPVFVPLGQMVRSTPKPGRTDFEDLARGILVIVDQTTAAEVAALHAGFLDGPMAVPPYQLRRQDLWVTSVRKADGGDVYLRSDRRGAGWVTTLVAAPREETADDLVISSIAAEGPPVLALPPGGLAAGWVAALRVALAEVEDGRDQPIADAELAAEREAAARREADRARAAASPPGPVDGAGVTAPDLPEQHEQASGTGFRVSPDGTLMTNHHVVAGCRRITADGLPATVVETSESFDLAILSVPDGAGRPWLPLATDGPRLNADVTVAGYPLHGLLGGINVTRGAISSLRGLSGDDHTIQVSAPIQPGNSGGAVVDRAGRVVGVVVAKLDEEALRRETGIISQNVNFAIRGDIARLMLDRAGIAYQTAAAGEALPPEDLADRLTAATALILCY